MTSFAIATSIIIIGVVLVVVRLLIFVTSYIEDKIKDIE